MIILFRFFFVGLLLVVSHAEAQRIYANAQQSSPTVKILLGTVTVSEVVNPGNSVDGDTANFATLRTLLGAAGLIEAWQNVQFTGASLPDKNSPVTLKFSTTGSIISVLGTLKIQYTKNGVAVGSTNLTSLIQVLAGQTVVEDTFPGPGVPYDGIKLTLSTTLSLAPTARLQYAFFIVAPAISDVTICSGQQATITVNNFQPGYQYKLYDVETGGTALSTFTTSTFLTPVLTSQKVYYVEAVQLTKYTSARTKVTVNDLPRPSAPLVHLDN